MPRKIIYILILFISLVSCGDKPDTIDENRYRINRSDFDRSIYELISEQPYNAAYNRGLLSLYNDTRQIDSICIRCRMLLKHTEGNGNSRLRDIAMTYLYHALLEKGMIDSLRPYQKEIERICLEDSTTFIGLLANNIAAINAINTTLDYSVALDHFNKGYRIAEAQSDTVNMAVFLSNISYIYLIREDKAGLDYAYKAYDLGLRSSQTHIQVNTITNLADLLLLEDDCDNSLRYSQEALNLTDQSSLDNCRSNIHTIRACALLKKGEMSEAGKELMLAKQYLDEADYETKARYWLENGNYLLATDDCQGAINSYRTGLKINGCSPEKKRQMLLKLSQSYSECDSDADALECYKRYHSLSDSLSVSQKEKDFNLLRIKYEQARYEQQLTENELTIERGNKTIIIIVSALLLISIAALAFYLLYRKQNQMYRQIVEQHQQHLKREQKIREENMQKKQGNDNEDSRERELYTRIEALMNDRKAFRQNDISLDRLSEMLESNRSYISGAINRFSGMTFINYINYKRIEEATRILSDPDDDTPLKKLADDLGFNSISTFYRVFQKEIGCPPSKYREEIRKINV